MIDRSHAIPYPRRVSGASRKSIPSGSQPDETPAGHATRLPRVDRMGDTKWYDTP
jgi:hypothetical protein